MDQAICDQVNYIALTLRQSRIYLGIARARVLHGPCLEKDCKNRLPLERKKIPFAHKTRITTSALPNSVKRGLGPLELQATFSEHFAIYIRVSGVALRALLEEYMDFTVKKWVLGKDVGNWR